MLIDDLETAVARGSFYPVLRRVRPRRVSAWPSCSRCSPTPFPSPLEHPLPAVTRPDGSRASRHLLRPARPAVAEVVKTTTDPYVGRISLVRVFSGTLRPDAAVHVSGHGLADRGHEDHDVDEKVGALSSPLGKTLRPVANASPATSCAIAKLAHAETGDTLSTKDDPLLMSAWEMPEPLLPVAIARQAKADEDKLSHGLSRLVAEDPTLRLERNAETAQLILWCMGEAHADVLLDRLHAKYGVEVEIVPLRVPLRETFAGKVTGARPPRQAVRRPRPVRGVRHRVRAAAGGRRLRVRRQGLRRLGTPPVHPVGREGRPHPDGARRRRRLSRCRHPGDAAATARRTRSTPPTWRSRSPAHSR